MAQGIESAGVLAVGKHFPGHGNTSTDSHTSLPRVEKDMTALNETEMVPFRALIDSGIKMLMCAHIQFPELDDTTFTSIADGQEAIVPATFSRRILTDLLRKDMGFNGVVITDAMNMDAVAKNVTPEDAVVMTLQAGADLICMPVEVRCAADESKIQSVIRAVAAAAKRGDLPLERINEAAERVVRLKIETGLLEKTFSEAEDEAAVLSALEIVGCAAHREMERKIAEDAIALVRDDLSALPLKPRDGETVLLITPYANETFSALYGFNRLKAEDIVPDGVALETYVYRGKNLIEDDLSAALERADYIILQTEMSGASSLLPGHWLTDLPTAVWNYVKAAGKQKNFVHASIGAPFDIMNYTECPAQLLSFGCVGMSEADAVSGVITAKYGPNLPALLGAVFGAFSPNGTIPVTIQ
jgi:beta-N-acetylhexosaminidase